MIRSNGGTLAGAKRPWWIAVAAAGVIAIGWNAAADPVGAQDPPAAAEAREIPAAEDVQLTTSDGQKIFARFYPGTMDKESLPVIMLHAWDVEEADRKHQFEIALVLQKELGAAVIVPDLRGHGKSELPESTVDISRWRAPQLSSVVEDIEACKQYLVGLNNEGKLNIDMLAVIAEHEVSIQAAIWTLRDWSYPEIAGKKQGQDVKALVLLNPHRNHNGLNGTDVYRNPLFTGEPGYGFPILVANNSREEGDSDSLYSYWERTRRKLDEPSRNLEWVGFHVESEQYVWTNDEDQILPLAGRIAEFLRKSIFDRRHDMRWTDRSIK